MVTPKPRRFVPVARIVPQVDEQGRVVLDEKAFGDSKGIYVARDLGLEQVVLSETGRQTEQLVVVKFTKKGQQAISAEAAALESLVEMPQVPALVLKGNDFVISSKVPGQYRGNIYTFPPEKFVFAAAQLLRFLKGVAAKGLSYYDFHGRNILLDEEDNLSVVDHTLTGEMPRMKTMEYSTLMYLLVNELFGPGRVADVGFDYLAFAHLPPDAYSHRLGLSGKLADQLASTSEELLYDKLKDLVITAAATKGMAEDAALALFGKADSRSRDKQGEKGLLVSRLRQVDSSSWDVSVTDSYFRSTAQGVVGVVTVPSLEELSRRIEQNRQAAESPEERRWEGSIKEELARIGRGEKSPLHYFGSSFLEPPEAPYWYRNMLLDMVFTGFRTQLYGLVSAQFKSMDLSLGGSNRFEAAKNALPRLFPNRSRNAEEQKGFDEVIGFFVGNAAEWHKGSLNLFNDFVSETDSHTALQKYGGRIKRLGEETTVVLNRYNEVLALARSEHVTDLESELSSGYYLAASLSATMVKVVGFRLTELEKR